MIQVSYGQILSCFSCFLEFKLEQVFGAGMGCFSFHYAQLYITDILTIIIFQVLSFHYWVKHASKNCRFVIKWTKNVVDINFETFLEMMTITYRF